MTGTRRPRRPLAGRATTGRHRAISTLRHVKAELLLASEIMFRPAGAPRPRPRADGPDGPDAHAAATTARAERGPRPASSQENGSRLAARPGVPSSTVRLFPESTG